ncbi:MAG: 23S rRNA (adenine(2503)-C(2))-methyltransferase RlmN [Spirochaetales bacterium]|nr:23S rRNA (adenine(2503)-C(2))-methyltransferase RlmN [Spirochaetales bacterium]
MIPLAGLLPAELSARLELTPAYRGRQLFEWIHSRLVFSFAQMTNIPEPVREALAARASVLTLESGPSVRAPDGTVKFRFTLPDGPAVEAVLLQDREGRHTACLSTQAGCAMGCRFCRTGQLGLVRNLRDYEIVEQLLLLRSTLRGAGERVDSVVFMGMGEPLANLDALRRAVTVLTHPAGSGMSLRRLTISTCGLVQGILELAESGPHTRLAVSLVSADPRVREQLMPVAAANPLPALRRALLRFQGATGKRLTLEIVLLQGINDREEDVEALLGFLSGAGSADQPLRALVNLIPWNEVPGMTYRRPSAARVTWFEQRLREAGVKVAVRASRGGAVAGACGQLG